jgi:hypothetical protein
MSYRRALLRAGCVGVALAAGAQRAPAQTTSHATLAAGPADVHAGSVGHLGLRVAPGGRSAWAQLRADVTAGRLREQVVRGATVALELGPPETRTAGVRLFGLAGGSAVRTGPSRADGLMAGAGARVRVGRIALSAEQRFQAGFSPLLVGISF